MTNNYTLGRGEIWFAQFLADSLVAGGERYFGNTPEFNISVESESLDHYDSDHGVNEMDDSVTTSTSRSASIITDHIDPKNLAMFFMGSSATFTVTGATITDEAHNAVEQGLTYQLGITPTNPVGARELDLHSTGPDVKIVVKNDAGSPTTYDEGDDYTIDMVSGRLTIVAGGAITTGTNLEVSYKTKSSTRDRVISGGKPIEGALRYLAFNPAGKQIDYYMPRVKISPTGDLALKGDEWQQIPFSVEILKKSGREAVYADGRPLVS